MPARADLHVHSRHSNRPSEWLLRRIGAPECFTEPRDVYDLCKRRGMDFVTISDHDTIAGALEIAHLPGTFLSSEVTASFPDDGCKVHLLVLGVSEAQHREIQRLRGNLYELRDYLLDQGIVHSLAHALFRVDDQLTVDHLEKLLVLFKRFELINGARDPRASILVRAVLLNLTAPLLESLAERHGIDPRDAEPWRKQFTAGSDDHSGLHIATAWTEVPAARSVTEYLNRLTCGEGTAAGSSGSSLKLARSFYRIAYRYYRDCLLAGSGSSDLLAELFSRLLDGEGPAGGSRAERLREAVTCFVRPRAKLMGAIDSSVAEQLVSLAEVADGACPATAEQRSFQIASRLSQQLSYAALRKFTRNLEKGKLTASLNSLSSLGPVALCIAPYLAAFHTQHKDEALHQAVAERFTAARLLRRRSGRRAWFTDTFGEVNGVASAVRACARLARARNLDLEVVTCRDEAASVSELPVRNFRPVGKFKLPDLDPERLAFPPFLEILEHCERERVAEIVVSTPGPVGLVGLAAARLLGARLVGIVHADYPLYVRHLTESPSLEGMTWRYVRWFFAQADTVYVPGRSHLAKLAASGLSPEALRPLPTGVDLDLFSPARRDPAFWRRFGLGDEPKVLCVGRIAREKNIDALLRAFLAAVREGERASLVVVGEGAYLAELVGRYRRPEILFTGHLSAEDVAAAYASADLYVHPGAADTFATTVLEAQASGLPAIVHERGGARELVEPGVTGLVVDPEAPGELGRAIAELLADPRRREAMGERAVEQARRASWEPFLEELFREDWSAPELAPEAARRGDALPALSQGLAVLP